MVFRGGHWYLVGHDHDRDGIRAFRLSRVTTGPTDLGEGSAPPAGFRAIEHVEAGPWNTRDASHARVAFGPAAAVLAEASLPGAVREQRRADGWTILSVPAADPATLAPLVLGYGPEAEVLEPAVLRDEVVRRLTAVLDG